MLIILGVVACNSPARDANSVTLAWDPNPEPDIAGYILYYGPASGVYSSSVTVTNAATCSVSNLLAGVTYYFAVIAYDAAWSQSDPSNEISYTVPAPSGAPSLDPIPNLTISVDAGPQTVALAGISPRVLNLGSLPVTVTAASSNPGLISNLAVQFSTLQGNGALTFTTPPGGNGMAIVTVTASVTVLAPISISRSFTVRVVPLNQPPSISAFDDMVATDEEKPITLPFRVHDAETPADNLVLMAESSNEALIRSADILFGGIGAARTVTLQPLSNEFGSALITITVIDADGARASTAFELDVNPVKTVVPPNQPPSISALPGRVMNDDDTPVTVPFHVNDAETPADNLLLIVESSNEELISGPGMVFGGTGTNRTLTLRPLTNDFGSATIMIIVLDASGAWGLGEFELEVNPVNDPPTISGLPNQVTTQHRPVTVSFVVDDVESLPDDLAVFAVSSNEALLPAANVILSGSGAQRILTLIPAPNVFGTALITVAVIDDGASNNITLRAFTVVVQPPLLQWRVLSPGNITLSWPASLAGFQLESTDALFPPNWNSVATPPQLVQDQNTVSVEVSGTARFFRLRKP